MSENIAELHFSEHEILRLYRRFKSIHDAKDGKVAIRDVLGLKPELQDNPLTERVLSVFDKDRDGNVSFAEFVNGLSRVDNDEESKVRFLFDVYDFDKDGFISNSDLFHVVKLMARDVPCRHLQQLVDRTLRDCDTDRDGKLCFDEFHRAVSQISIGQQLDVEI